MNPNRFYAVPLLGILVKFIMLIPVIIVLWAISIATTILIMIVNPFIVLFTGNYWDSAYEFAVMLMVYTTKLFFFLSGMTDKYPGFNFKPEGFELTINRPSNPGRLYAIPLLGILIRGVLLIPYLIFSSVLKYAAYLAVLVNFAPVLFMGQYSESFYELVLDFQRVSLAQSMYVYGLSDSYPSFKISWNHQGVKVALIIIGAVLMILQITSSLNHPKAKPTNFTPNYSSQAY